MLSILVIIISVAQIILALFVYFKQRNNLTNILFALLSVAAVGWVLANYASIGILNSPSVIYAARATLFFVVIQNTLFYLFARTFPRKSWLHSRRWLLAYLIFSVVAASATLSPFVFTSAVLQNGQPHATAGPGIMVFMFHAALSIIIAFRSLIKKVHGSYGNERSQVRLLLWASVLNWGVVPLTNFILPAVVNSLLFVQISPVYTLLFTSMIAYSIISQKLFDIRAAVARSVAYALMVATMALVYSISLFGVVNLLFPSTHQETLRQVLSVALVFPLALSFQSIKSFFDRLTDKVFYKDSYDVQAVLGRLGRNVAAETNLNKVVDATRLILSTAIKSSFIEFLLFDNERVFLEEPDHRELNQHLAKLSHLKEDQRRTVLVAGESASSSPTKNILNEAGVAISVKLKTQKDTMGFILLGEKLNGDIYNSKDQQLLAIVANDLAIATQNALRFEQVQEFNLTLQQKVDEATRRLRQTNEKLKKLDETKDDFISMASHQLRTPLTSVKGYVSMVLDGDAGKINKQQHDLLNQAFISSERMVYLIADLLNVSRLRTGKFIIEPAATNLVEVIDGEIAQLTESAKSRNLTLSFDRPKQFPQLMLDETKIRQVIMNFSDNAIYYTPSGGQITIKLEDKTDSIEFTVTDNGIGVPKHEQHHLFGKFYRAGNARKARPDGTGLGLFMAKKVIVASGGALIFKSEEGKGSTFGFSFPKHKLLVK